MRTKGIKMLVICAIANTAVMARSDSYSFAGYEYSAHEIRGHFRRLETDIGDINKATEHIMAFARSDGINLASPGHKEALEWARKYVGLYPPKETESYGSEWDTSKYDNLSFDEKRKQIFAYLAFKGDARDLEVVKRFDRDTLGAILERRVAGENIFGYDADKLKPLGFLGQPKTFFPSVANTGPQAVYVREILYRYWEENGRDKSKIPQELLTMVVSFDADGIPVCSVDLAKYGLSIPIFTPRPDMRMFSIYKEGIVSREHTPSKFTVKFPDLAEAVEITTAMEREAPDWKGLYKHVRKVTPPQQQNE